MRYSQILEVTHIDNTCAKCEKTFDKWSDYYTHVSSSNCVEPRQLPPVSSKRNLVGVKNPLTDEKKSAIIATWELKHKGVIIQ